MKTLFLIIFFILLQPHLLRANRELVGSVNKKGITINFSYSSKEKSEKFVDSILNKIVTNINRKDTTLQILVIVNNSYLSYYKYPNQNFISLGYDTIRNLDFEFIYNYCNNQNIASGKINMPLDINATNSDTIKNIGLKIIYSSDTQLGEPDWSIVEKLIYYSVNNLEIIKRTQTRNNVLYGFKIKWPVSLVTLDTLSIQDIIKNNSISKKNNNSNYKYFLLLLPLGLFFSWKRKYRR